MYMYTHTSPPMYTYIGGEGRRELERGDREREGVGREELWNIMG